MDYIDGIKTALKNIKTVGTVTFSSKFLVQKIAKQIDYTQGKNIVELGAGNGCITKELLSRMNTDAQLFSFEINDLFCEHINKQITDKRLHLIHDSAEKLGDYLQNAQVNYVDYVVSTIPLIVLPKAVNERILNEIWTHLKPGGLYIQLSYMPNTKRLFKKQFPKSITRFAPLNLPPAFVFVAEKTEKLVSK